jgi:type II secretory pathway predicted ATPase ExeA
VYEAFFGLRSRPFSPLPRVETYIPLAPVREPFESLVRCIAQEQGIGVLTAPSGAGKSLICRMLQHQFQDQRRTVLLTTARFPTRRALLQAILFELKHPFVGLSEQESRLRVLDLLQASPAPQNRMLLIVDEAHLLSPRGLEELRTLTDYEIAGRSCVSLILSGQLELEELLTQPDMNAFNQRVGCHVCIEPLTFEESAQYLRERLRFAGNDGLTIFTPEAIQLICSASEGNPRRLNQLGDHSLLLAYAEEQRPVDESVVRAALLDLRELPLHWNAPLDLTHDSDRNPLEAFAESYAEEQATLDDEPLADDAIDEDSSFGASNLAQASPLDGDTKSSVFEVGGPIQESLFDQLFQASRLIVPGESLPPVEVETPLGSFAQESPTPATSHAFETAPPEAAMGKSRDEYQTKDQTVSLEALPEMEFESGGAFAGADEMSTPLRTNEFVRGTEFEELVVDDAYARIDRHIETTIRLVPPERKTPGGLASSTSAEAALPMIPFPRSDRDYDAGNIHDTRLESTPAPGSIETATDLEMAASRSQAVLLERQLLDFIQEIGLDVHQARQEREAARRAAEPSSPRTGDTEDAPRPRHQSLRESLQWQFDVVEPQSDEHALDPSTGDLPRTSSSAIESCARTGETVQSTTATTALAVEDPREPTPLEERRYAQLFTRLQRQRRRVETVMTREHRSGAEAR